MTSHQGMLDGFDPPRSRAAEIARVLVDVDLPHMDRPLDYVVPDKFIDEAEVGRAVRVRFPVRAWTAGSLSVHVAMCLTTPRRSNRYRLQSRC